MPATSVSDWVYRFGEFELDAQERVICRAGKPVALTPKAFDLLLTLVERHGHLVGKEELLSLVWPGTFVEESNLSYNMSVLRKALGDAPEQPALIETVPKRGYRFVAAVSATLKRPADHAAGIDALAGTRPVRRWIRGGGRHWKALTWTGITLAMLLLAADEWRASRPHRTGMEFQGRSLVLVAEFQNHTGDRNLGGVLETALEAELAQSPYIGITPRERANDALLLMRQPPAPRVPAALAREVCLRDSAIRAAITGEIREIGAGYLLVAEIIRPSDDAVVSSMSKTAPDKNAILPAVRSIAQSIGVLLAGKLQERDATPRPLANVTTAFLPALKLYSDAEASAAQNHWAESEVLLRRAVQMDPQFASAQVLLAWAIHNQRPSAEQEFLPFAERAMALADTTSERESFFIRGSYFTLSGQHRKAIPYYEAIVTRYPEDAPWASANLVWSYREARQYTQATILSRALVRMRPNDPAAYSHAAASCFCPPVEDPGDARSFLDRAIELVRQRGDRAAMEKLRMERAYYSALGAWLEEDVERCRTEIDRMAEMLPDDDLWIANAAIAYMTLGQLERAGRLLERVADTSARLRWGTFRALLAGDITAARRMAASLSDERPNPLSALAMIRAGQTPAAARMIQRWPRAFYSDAALVAQGGLALQMKPTGNAVEGLLQAVQSISDAPLAERWLGTQVLAEAYLAQGDPGRAISALEVTASAPRACGGFPTAVFWPQTRYDLMQLYRRQNRFKEADAIRNQLDRLLRVADANYVIRAALAHQ